VDVPTPPVATEYHNKFVPVAVNATAVVFWQYTTGDVVGAVGVVFTVTTRDALGPSQAPIVELT
jgi:hypothetical protein